MDCSLLCYLLLNIVCLFLFHSVLSTQYSSGPGRHAGIDGLAARDPVAGEFVLLYLRADDDIAADRDVRRDARVLADEREARVHTARFEHVRRVIISVTDAAARADEGLLVDDAAIDDRALG